MREILPGPALPTVDEPVNPGELPRIKHGAPEGYSQRLIDLARTLHPHIYATKRRAAPVPALAHRLRGGFTTLPGP